MTYRSLADFLEDTVQTCDQLPDTVHRDNLSDYQNIQESSSDSWRYGSEYSQDNYFRVRFDASKGKKLCENSLKTLMAGKEYKSLVQQALTYKKKLSYTDTGSKLSVSRAIAGEDRYFVKTKNAARPTVKIAINVGVSACVDDRELVNIAVSAVPVVYALETAGICTEIWLCCFTKSQFYNVPFKYSVTQVCVKTAQQRFNWTMFAPTFTSGIFRHSMFLTWLRQPYEISSGYGSPMDSDDIANRDNFDYAAVIGANGPGPVKQIEQIFSKIKR